MPVLRGLKPTAKINCRYATDKFHLLGMRTGKISCSMETPTHWHPPQLPAKNKVRAGRPRSQGPSSQRRLILAVGFNPRVTGVPHPPVAWRRLNVTPTTQVTRLHILACCTPHRRNMPRPNRKHAGGTPALPGFQVFPLIRAYSRLAWLRAMSDNRRSLARLASRSARAAGSAMRLALRSASRSRSSLGMSSG